MVLALLLKHCETSRIMQRCLLSPSRMLRNFIDYATKLVWTSGMLQNFMDYATMLALTFRLLQNFTDYATMLGLTSGVLRNFTDYATKLILTFGETRQSSQADRQCPRTKLGYESYPSLLIFYWR